MKTYLVRYEDKTLIGIFTCRDERELAMIIDEKLDPTVCEYVELKKNGGVFLFSDKVVGEKYEYDDEEDTDINARPEDFKCQGIAENWFDYFSPCQYDGNRNTFKWRKINGEQFMADMCSTDVENMREVQKMTGKVAEIAKQMGIKNWS